MTTATVVCGSCGTELPPNAKFCNECGAAVSTATTPAEYKQVTVLFADVVVRLGGTYGSSAGSPPCTGRSVVPVRNNVVCATLAG